jgi:hypothetical protein
MGSPQIGAPPPAPVRSAAVIATHEHQPAIPAAARPARTAAWDALVRAAAIRSRNFQEMARQHFVHLRVFGSAETLRLRHTLVLRVARFEHVPALFEGHRRVIRR